MIEFIQARLAEDEAAALRATNWLGPWELENTHHHTAADADFFSRNTARRVRREVEAKRALLAMAKGALHAFGVKDSEWLRWHEPALRHLAVVYADHPDYDEEWRP